MSFFVNKPIIIIILALHFSILTFLFFLLNVTVFCRDFIQVIPTRTLFLIYALVLIQTMSNKMVAFENGNKKISCHVRGKKIRNNRKTESSMCPASCDTHIRSLENFEDTTDNECQHTEIRNQVTLLDFYQLVEFDRWLSLFC